MKLHVHMKECPKFIANCTCIILKYISKYLILAFMCLYLNYLCQHLKYMSMTLRLSHYNHLYITWKLTDGIFSSLRQL